MDQPRDARGRFLPKVKEESPVLVQDVVDDLYGPGCIDDRWPARSGPGDEVRRAFLEHEKNRPKKPNRNPPAISKGEPSPRLSDEPLMAVIVASVLVIVLCIAFLHT